MERTDVNLHGHTQHDDGNIELGILEDHDTGRFNIMIRFYIQTDTRLRAFEFVGCQTTDEFESAIRVAERLADSMGMDWRLIRKNLENGEAARAAKEHRDAQPE